jgi:hypothetical protein
MAVIERLADISAKSGTEKYAPPNKRALEKLNDVAVPRSAAEPANDSADKYLNDVIRRVAGASMQEIDLVVSELQGVRDMLRKEGERVTREISGYAALSHASMTAMKVIGDSIKQWKGVPDKTSSRPVA